jgi:hypothetical protein
MTSQNSINWFVSVEETKYISFEVQTEFLYYFGEINSNKCLKLLVFMCSMK